MRLAELSGYAAFLALAQTNRGEAQLGLGRLDEAIAELEAAKVTYQRMGSHKVAYPLGDLGLVYRERGDLALAKAAYEEAVGFAELSGDLQGLVPALAGLARVVAGDEPDRAAELADRALGYGPGMAWVEAQLAAGWVALAAGERERASAAAAAAATAAGTRRDRAGLAEALELRALAAPDPAGELPRLREAASIWAAIGNRLGEARNALAQARLAGSAAGDRGTSRFPGGPGGVRGARSPPSSRPSGACGRSACGSAPRSRPGCCGRSLPRRATRCASMRSAASGCCGRASRYRCRTGSPARPASC